MSAEQIAKKLGQAPTTIWRFLAKYKTTGNLENLPKSGRPSALNEEKKILLIKAAIEERYKSLKNIINDLQLWYKYFI